MGVVCGGDQSVHYDLREAKLDNAVARAWDLELSVRKFGFEMCIVCGYGLAEADDPRPISCSVKSFIAKSCSIRFSVGASADTGNGARVEAEVLELKQQTHVVDDLGLPVSGMLMNPRNRRGFSARLFGIVGAVVNRA